VQNFEIYLRQNISFYILVGHSDLSKTSAKYSDKLRTIFFFVTWKKKRKTRKETIPKKGHY